MVDAKDVRGLRVARTELSKRGIDLTRGDIRMLHGVLYIKGGISICKGAEIHDLKGEMEHIARILRQKSEIRDVVLDCMYLA